MVLRGGPVSGGATVVVFIRELVQQQLYLGERGWLLELSSQPFLQSLLKAFDFALGLRVIG